MALTSLIGGLWTMVPPPATAGTPSLSSTLIDASGEKAAFVFQVPRTGTLDQAEVRLRSVTQAPAGGLRVSFQDVSLSDGNPDGTADQYRVVTSGLTAQAWVSPGSMTHDGTAGGTKRSVTRGAWLAVVIEFASFDSGDSLEIGGLNTNGVSGIRGAPYTTHFTTAWAKLESVHPVMALKYDDGAYVFVAPWMYPFSAINSVSYNSGSTPDERGLIVQVPVAVKVGGAWIRMGMSSGNADVVLYGADGATQIETVALDADFKSTATARTFMVWFSEDHELAANTSYRLTLRPSSGTNVELQDFDVPSAALLDAVEGGQASHYTHRTDAGSWTQTATKRPMMGLLITAIHDGVGGGGWLHHAR